MMESCPECGSNLVKICYGFPSSEMWEQYERKEIYLGGCETSILAYYCFQCQRSIPDCANETEYRVYKMFEMKLHELLADSPFLYSHVIQHLVRKEDILKALEIMISGKDEKETKNLLWEILM